MTQHSSPNDNNNPTTKNGIQYVDGEENEALSFSFQDSSSEEYTPENSPTRAAENLNLNQVFKRESESEGISVGISESKGDGDSGRTSELRLSESGLVTFDEAKELIVNHDDDVDGQDLKVASGIVTTTAEMKDEAKDETIEVMPNKQERELQLNDTTLTTQEQHSSDAAVDESILIIEKDVIEVNASAIIDESVNQTNANGNANELTTTEIINKDDEKIEVMPNKQKRELQSQRSSDAVVNESLSSLEQDITKTTDRINNTENDDRETIEQTNSIKSLPHQNNRNIEITNQSNSSIDTEVMTNNGNNEMIRERVSCNMNDLLDNATVAFGGVIEVTVTDNELTLLHTSTTSTKIPQPLNTSQPLTQSYNNHTPQKQKHLPQDQDESTEIQHSEVENTSPPTAQSSTPTPPPQPSPISHTVQSIRIRSSPSVKPRHIITSSRSPSVKPRRIRLSQEHNMNKQILSVADIWRLTGLPMSSGSVGGSGGGVSGSGGGVNGSGGSGRKKGKKGKRASLTPLSDDEDKANNGSGSGNDNGGGSGGKSGSRRVERLREDDFFSVRDFGGGGIITSPIKVGKRDDRDDDGGGSVRIAPLPFANLEDSVIVKEKADVETSESQKPETTIPFNSTDEASQGERNDTAPSKSPISPLLTSASPPSKISPSTTAIDVIRPFRKSSGTAATVDLKSESISHEGHFDLSVDINVNAGHDRDVLVESNGELEAEVIDNANTVSKIENTPTLSSSSSEVEKQASSNNLEQHTADNDVNVILEAEPVVITSVLRSESSTDTVSNNETVNDATTTTTIEIENTPSSSSSSSDVETPESSYNLKQWTVLLGERHVIKVKADIEIRKLEIENMRLRRLLKL